MSGNMFLNQFYYNGRYVKPFPRNQRPDNRPGPGSFDYHSDVYYHYDARNDSRSSSHVCHDTRRDSRRSARLTRPRPLRNPYSTGRGPRRPPLCDFVETNPYKLVNERPILKPVETQMIGSSSSPTTSATTAFATAAKCPSNEQPLTESENVARLTIEAKNPASMSLSEMISVANLYVKLFDAGLVKTPSGINKVEVNAKETVTREKDTPNVVDLLKPETLREKRPDILSQMYGGKQCSGCSQRFAPEQSAQYSRHLDWHFGQNRRDKDTARRALGRGSYYSYRNWMQHSDTEGVVEKGSNWFEASTSRPGASEKLLSVPAGSLSECCGLCGDKFEQFYHEEADEWHLRDAVRYQDFVFHPQCCEDYKASLVKKENKMRQLLEE